ncbi:MAG: class I SAM-dependent RNA methyltransferase [Nitrospiraceae bacterium]|nr:MAG: class I SAM-dependent RNA methyltransferase [Nitrospiraceae bacterium]
MAVLVIKIDRPAYGGMSIGRHDGKIVMVKGAVMPGETAEVVIEDEKKDYLSASVKKIIEPSPRRIVPACKYSGRCGGCQLQHIPYDLQLEVKEEILRDCLRRLAKEETRLSGPLFDGNPWNYRVRGQFKVSREGIGFCKNNSIEVVDIDSCPLMTEEINTLLVKIKPAVRDFDMTEIHITAGDCFTALVRLPSRTKHAFDMNALSSRFLDLGFSGICIETPDKKISRYGESCVALDLRDLKYSVSPMTFIQSHWRLNQRVAGFIKDSLGPLRGARVLDMYSGAGNFSMPLAPDAVVTALEENPYAAEDGRRSLEINGIKNYRFITSSAENFHTREDFDIVILDPPRQGLANRVINSVLSIGPEKIVYISCNPATFARDLKKLQNKYDMESVRMIDFFPQTFHIETLAFLRLR